MIKGKEIFLIKAIKTLESGEVLEVTKTFDHKDFPHDSTKANFDMLEGFCLYREEFDGGQPVMHMNLYCVMNPELPFSVKTIKPLFSGFFKKSFKKNLLALEKYCAEGKNKWDAFMPIYF